MSADDDDITLDDRIRALVAAAVADAPEAPEVDVVGARDVTLVGSAATPSSRRALVGVAAVVAVIAGLWVVVTTGSTPVADDATEGTEAIGDPSWVTAVEPTEVSNVDAEMWPDDVAVIVASRRGIERVTAPNGIPEVTRVYSAGPVSRAFELSDGSYVFHTTDGLVQRLLPGSAPDETGQVEILAKGVVTLDDAQLDPTSGALTVVFRTGSRTTGVDFSLLTVMRPPAEPLVIELSGGWAVDYGRFDLIEGDTVASGWVDDTLQRGIAAFDASGAPVDRFDIFFGRGEGGPRDVVGDITGQTGVLSDSVFDVVGSVLQSMELLDMSNRSGDLDLQGATVAIDRPAGPDTIVDLRYRSTFEVPIADGVTTVSQRTFGVPRTEVDTWSTCMSVHGPSNGNELADGVVISTMAPPVPLPPARSDAWSTIEVAGRSATLATATSGQLVVELSPPHWCGLAWLSTDRLDVDEFVEWLAGVQVTERIPEGLPPMVLAGARGVSLIADGRTQVVTTEPASRAVILGTGDVVYQRSDGLVFTWRHDTGVVEEMWAAVSWVAAPRIHDTFGGRLVFSVADRLYVDGTSVTLDLGVEPTGRLSVSDDGLVLGSGVRTTITADGAIPDWIGEASTDDVLWAIDGGVEASRCCVVLYSGGTTVVDRAGVAQWTSNLPFGVSVSGIDVRGNWLAWQFVVADAETPAAWRAPGARVIDLDTGLVTAFSGVGWVSFAD